MLTAEDNVLLTRVGPGTPGGEMLRRYWQPAALSEELPVNGPPLPVRLLGEDLVLFRDNQGLPGLLGIHCSHRGADLSYGRLEDGGLRCIYHGWLYDISGRCLEQPGEGLDSTFHKRIQHPAHPCIEQAGVIFAYLGPGEPPLLPAYDFLTAPIENSFAIKLFSDCNYLQGNEGNQDPVHLSFLHLVNMDQRRDGQSALMSEQRAPQIDIEITYWGVRIYAIRPAGPDARYVRLTNTVLPNLTCFGGGTEDGHSVNWHVPIDDTHHWKYTFIVRLSGPLDKQATARGRADMQPDYLPIRHRGNRYLQDREEQKRSTFIGMGNIFQIHDLCATEGAGPIQDRTAEHLGPSDIGIVAARKLMLKAIKDVQEGRDPPHVVRSPEANSFPDLVTVSGLVPNDVEHRSFWKPEARHQLVSVR
jgi:phthalate 4,5-dioxygenase oxygenase subunit